MKNKTHRYGSFCICGFFFLRTLMRNRYRILERKIEFEGNYHMNRQSVWNKWKDGMKTLGIYLQKTLLSDFLSFLKWVAIALVSGVVIGVAGTAFHLAIGWAEQTRDTVQWIPLLLPAGGLLIVFLYHIAGMDTDPGTDLVLFSVRSKSQVSWKTAPLIFAATVITHLLGGSAGREGAALQLGGSLGSVLGRLFRLDIKDMHIITLCGMSAGFSALFGTPMAAAIFAMEVVSVGVMYYAALVPCVLAALVASQISFAAGSHATAFPLAESVVPEISAAGVAQVVILAALCALVSILVCLVFHKTSLLYRKFLRNPYLRIAVGGILVIGLAMLLGTRDYLGAGMPVIQRAINGEARPEAFILKLLFTALTLGAGFKGGEIVPSFFIGATFGCIAAGFLGLPPEFAAALGLAAVFCGVTNCPVSSFVLSMELFGAQGALYFLLAVSVSYALSGYYGLYSKQKILYSKTRPVFIDVQTK